MHSQSGTHRRPRLGLKLQFRPHSTRWLRALIVGCVFLTGGAQAAATLFLNAPDVGQDWASVYGAVGDSFTFDIFGFDQNSSSWQEPDLGAGGPLDIQPAGGGAKAAPYNAGDVYIFTGEFSLDFGGEPSSSVSGTCTVTATITMTVDADGIHEATWDIALTPTEDTIIQDGLVLITEPTNPFTGTLTHQEAPPAAGSLSSDLTTSLPLINAEHNSLVVRMAVDDQAVIEGTAALTDPILLRDGDAWSLRMGTEFTTLRALLLSGLVLDSFAGGLGTGVFDFSSFGSGDIP